MQTFFFQTSLWLDENKIQPSFIFTITNCAFPLCKCLPGKTTKSNCPTQQIAQQMLEKPPAVKTLEQIVSAGETCSGNSQHFFEGGKSGLKELTYQFY